MPVYQSKERQEYLWPFSVVNLAEQTTKTKKVTAGESISEAEPAQHTTSATAQYAPRAMPQNGRVLRDTLWFQ